MYLCIWCACCHSDKKRDLDHQEMELQLTVTHVGVGNSKILCKSNRRLLTTDLSLQHLRFILNSPKLEKQIQIHWQTYKSDVVQTLQGVLLRTKEGGE